MSGSQLTEVHDIQLWLIPGINNYLILISFCSL